MDNIRDDDDLISIDDFDFQPMAEECPECGAPTSEWVETRDYLNWHCPRCGNDFPIDAAYEEAPEFHDSTYDLDMTDEISDDEWDALDDEDLDALEEALGSSRKDLPNLAPPESKSSQPEGEITTYRNPPHHVSDLGTSDFGRKGMKEGFFDKRIEAGEHCDNQEELEAELAKNPKIEGEHEDGYKSPTPVREDIEDDDSLEAIVAEYSELEDDIRAAFGYCEQLYQALADSGMEDISSGDLDSMIRDGISGMVEDTSELEQSREEIVAIFDLFEDELGDEPAQELIERIEDVACSGSFSPLIEDTVKVKGGYQNVGKKGKHSKKPMTKKAADAQRKAMFANGYHEGVDTGKIQVSDSIASLIDMFMPELANDMKTQIANGNTEALRVALRQIDKGISKNVSGISEKVIRDYRAFRESAMSELDIERQEAEAAGEEWDNPLEEDHFVCFACDAEGSIDELDEVDGEYLCPSCGSSDIDIFQVDEIGDDDESPEDILQEAFGDTTRDQLNIEAVLRFWQNKEVSIPDYQDRIDATANEFEVDPEWIKDIVGEEEGENRHPFQESDEDDEAIEDVSSFPEPSDAKTITFDQPDDFEAIEEAIDWLKSRGYSVGRMNGDAPIGFKEGDWDIAKWWNLSTEDKKQLDGVITSPDFRHGPVKISFGLDVLREPEPVESDRPVLSIRESADEDTPGDVSKFKAPKSFVGRSCVVAIPSGVQTMAARYDGVRGEVIQEDERGEGFLIRMPNYGEVWMPKQFLKISKR